MKAIIYFSLTGHTKKVLEERFEGDFYRIRGKIKIPKKYWQQLVFLGMLASLGTRLKYEPIEVDLDQYDEIILGSPVWAFTIVPFMKKFLSKHKIKHKKITLLITHEGGPGRAMKHFKHYLDSSNSIIDEISIKTGKQYESATIIKK